MLTRKDIEQLYAGTQEHGEWTMCMGCKLSYPYRFPQCPRCGAGMQAPKLTLPYPGTEVYGVTPGNTDSREL